MAKEKYEGRVEHIESGQAIHFRSTDELLTFLNRILKEVFQAEDLNHEQGQVSAVDHAD